MKKNDYGDKMAINVFTKQKYFFFHGNRYQEDTIWKAINSFAIFEYYPFEVFFDEPRKTISEKELLEIYNKIKNGMKNELKEEKLMKEESKEVITDSILQTILKTNELVKNSIVDEKIKTEIVHQLEELGEYYVSAMMNINNEDNVLTLNNEYSIRMECIRKLAEIEDRFNNPEVVKTHSLKRQLKQFKNELK